MFKRYDTWIEGLRKLFFIGLIIGLLPLAMTMFIVLVLEVIIYLLPGQILELSKYYNDIYFISLIIFGPYYLQEQWEYVATKPGEAHGSSK